MAPLPMTLSVSQLVLRAKQLEIDAIGHLTARVALARITGELIHVLQRERGASSVYLASGGQRFAAERQAAMAEVAPVEAALRTLFETQSAPQQGASARILSLMAWVTLDLDALPALRHVIDQRSASAHDAVAAYSRLIAGLLELIFQVADAAQHPGISRLLVALVHLLQGKEAAGQERAVGAQLFASGSIDAASQQRVVQLIEAQERSLGVFEAFAEPALAQRWQALQLTPAVALLERLRRSLCTARLSGTLDVELSDRWFEACSERITALWHLQAELVQCLQHTCEAQRQAAQQDLQDSAGLLQRLRDNPPPHAHAVTRFFDADAHPDTVPVLPAMADGPAGAAAPQSDPVKVASLEELLRAQSARLAGMETELNAARRALHERKVIERAKGALMSRLGMSEEAAFRTLQKSAMDHNRRLLDVAEATLALPEAFFEAQGNAPQRAK